MSGELYRRPIYIFDLDGTLALIKHRRKYVEGPKKDWPAFYRACVDDEPNWPVIRRLEALRLTSQVLIFSGRSDEVKRETVLWLAKHTSFMPHELTAGGDLTMRQAGDYTPDDVLKRQWLHAMYDEDRKRIAAVFDDRDRVVRMWRSEGIPCFQVAEGEF